MRIRTRQRASPFNGYGRLRGYMEVPQGHTVHICGNEALRVGEIRTLDPSCGRY
jgi:hypothetical protein